MRRVIQRTVTTTKIISLTITHSESAEAVEYTLVDNTRQPGDLTPEHPRETLTPDDELPSTPDGQTAAQTDRAAPQ